MSASPSPPGRPSGSRRGRRSPTAVKPADPPPDPLQQAVQEAVQAYAGMQPQLVAAADGFVAMVRTLLDDAGINYLSVTGRAKSVESFAGKAARLAAGVDEGGHAAERLDPLEAITDQVGVRVITYLQGDVSAVAELLSDQLLVLDDRDMGQETASEGRFGYASRHLLVALDPGRPTSPAYEPLRGRRSSVQVRTVLQHAWAEFEHDIRYKGTVPQEHAPDLDRRFTLAAGLLELADREFSAIRERLQASMTGRQPDADSTDPRISAQDLATFLSTRFADAGWSRTDHYEWISGLLLELGVTSLQELAGLLAAVDSSTIEARMGYRYPAGAVRRLDDALLSVFGERYLDLHGNAHRTALLQTRLGKLTEA